MGMNEKPRLKFYKTAVLSDRTLRQPEPSRSRQKYYEKVV
jgi:hypothetical protein